MKHFQNMKIETIKSRLLNAKHFLVLHYQLKFCRLLISLVKKFRRLKLTTFF